MKKSGNIDHQIQLKRDEIERYKQACKNYPTDRMKKHAEPYLKKLTDELAQLKQMQSTSQ